MRKHNNLPQRFDFKKWVCAFTFTFSFSVLVLTIYTVPKLYTSNFMSNANQEQPQPLPNVSNELKETMGVIIEKLEQEIEEMKKISLDESSQIRGTAVKITAFLVEIREQIKQIQEGKTAIDGEKKQQEVIGVVEELFMVEEIRKYIRMKPNRLGKKNFMGANGTFPSIGHGCFAVKDELEEYMDYDVGEMCRDDWKLGQKLIVHGCDPLPRRRCFSTTPKFYTRPLPGKEATWSLPDDRNVRWNHYRCKNFTCLARNTTGKGFFKCSDCFNLTHHERPRWIEPTPSPEPTFPSPDFLIQEVLHLKPPGEVRIGLDFSVGTGTFAARMRDDHNITIITSTINFGAPFAETIALRGLVPLYLSVNQRLPFFDNTLDLIHTTRFLDGWIDMVLLDFVLFDWDRVLRPGGLLWIDSFFCLEKDLDGYLDGFRMLRYKKHKWVVVPKLDKDDNEVFFSAVLEKPLRPF